MSPYTFYLIGNAHLDPVWLWDWCEGLNEGLVTCRTILDLMDDYPELTFTRGEAAIYAHIEKSDPETFRRIARYVEQGRWDVVGGTYVQADTNLPATETFVRQYLHGQQYFAARFGRPVEVAWAADSFGHAAGLPDIMAQTGIRAFAFTRPDNGIVPLAKPAFWWEGPSGARVLAYRPPIGWYGSERDELPGKLDAYLAQAATLGLRNIPVFFGLGNHGGGPSRAQVEQILAWRAAHPDVRMVFSGLHGYFAALHDEVAAQGEGYLPVHRGELNFTLRGCYASMAKFKYPYRRTETAVSRAEATDTVVSAALGVPPANLRAAWEAVLFNSFHDILPGSSIERAYDDQLAWLGGARHTSRSIEFTALTALAQQVDTHVPRPEGDMPASLAGLAWNPLPVPYEGYLEWEGSLDYRPILAYRGRPEALPLQVCDPAGQPLPFQRVGTDHQCFIDLPWRERVLFPVTLPPLGWSVFTFGWVEGAEMPTAPPSPVSAPAAGTITNGRYTISAQAGDAGIRIMCDGQPLLTGDGLTARVYEDRAGSWGSFSEGQDATALQEQWHITQVETLETGPFRAKLWVRLAGAVSRLDLTLSLTLDRDAVDADARLFLNERAARVKLIFPGGSAGAYEVPGAVVERSATGEVPGGRWVQVTGPDTGFGFASDALYNFDCAQDEFRATLARASHYSREADTGPEEIPWRPTVDSGELKCRFVLTPGDDILPRRSAELEFPPQVLHVPASAGALPRTASLAALTPAALRWLALKPADDGRGVILRAHNLTDAPVAARLTWLGHALDLGVVPAHTIATWRLTPEAEQWTVEAVDLLERGV